MLDRGHYGGAKMKQRRNGRSDSDYAKVFAKALEMETPCDCCKMVAKCAKHQWACAQFYEFAMTGQIDEERSKLPNRSIYDLVFDTEEEFEKVA